MHTVRLCRDLTGWFATMSPDVPKYPGVRVGWAAAFESAEHAMRVLELAQALAHRLGDQPGAWGDDLRMPAHPSWPSVG